MKTSANHLCALAAVACLVSAGRSPAAHAAPACDDAEPAALAKDDLATCIAQLEGEIATRTKYRDLPKTAASEKEVIDNELKASNDRLKALKSVAYDVKVTTEKEARAAAQVEQLKQSSVQPQDSVELLNGQLRFGITTTLFKLQASRASDRPARERNFELKLAKLPLDLGFQFVFRPKLFPYRLGTVADKGFQLISVGGMFSIGMNETRPHQSSVIVGLIASFFEDRASLGVGFDLYRGIPVADQFGASGLGTARTGLMGWAFSRTGEITAENFSLLMTINLAPVGEGK